MPHPYFEGLPKPRVLAHRGLVTPGLEAAGAAENSLASVIAAIDAGADYVESDCHLTRDGKVVLFHDSDLRRVTGDPRSLAAVDSHELAELMADRGGLLTLAEALERFAGTRFNLDIKAGAAAVPAGELIAPHTSRVLLTSFSDRHRLRALRAVLNVPGRGSAQPRLPATSAGRSTLVRLLAALAVRSSRYSRRALENIDALQIPERYGRLRVLSPRLIETAHRLGVEVHVWTVNDPERMRYLVALGVDGIVTDRADIALKTLR